MPRGRKKKKKKTKKKKQLFWFRSENPKQIFSKTRYIVIFFAPLNIFSFGLGSIEISWSTIHCILLALKKVNIFKKNNTLTKLQLQHLFTKHQKTINNYNYIRRLPSHPPSLPTGFPFNSQQGFRQEPKTK